MRRRILSINLIITQHLNIFIRFHSHLGLGRRIAYFNSLNLWIRNRFFIKPLIVLGVDYATAIIRLITSRLYHLLRIWLIKVRATRVHLEVVASLTFGPHRRPGIKLWLMHRLWRIRHHFQWWLWITHLLGFCLGFLHQVILRPLVRIEHHSVEVLIF